LVKRILLLAVVALLLMGSNLGIFQPTAAQDNTLTLGERVSADFAGTAVQFTLEGKKDQFVVVQYVPDVENPIYGGKLKISDPSGNVIADSSELIIFSQLGCILGVQLEEDGAYTVEVVADDNGTFELLAIEAIPLELDKPVEGSTTSTPETARITYDVAYVIDTTDEVVLNYERTGGDYVPTVIVDAVEAGNNLYPLSYLGGRALNKGSLTLEKSRMYRFVVLGYVNFSDRGNGEARSADFTLTLSKPN